MKYKKLAIAAALSLSMGFIESARADSIYALSETFESGATFNGNVTFDVDFNAIAVNGVLTGYSTSQTGPVYVAGGFVIDSSVSESINWVDYVGYNYAVAPISQNRLDDADPSGLVSNSILFTIDFTNPASPSFNTISDLSYNGINTYSNTADPLVSGSVAQVPLPAAIWLFGWALAGFIGFSRHKSAGV
ncbi:MAG: hypothetical protein WCS87_03305 [Methylococcaceae bacterium]